jgi:hypothetical protein
VHGADGGDSNPSLSVSDRGGKVLVHCFSGCSQADVIQALRSQGLWPERERRDRHPADLVRYAERRRHIERLLPSARRWRRAALALCAEQLELLKGALFDSSVGVPEPFEVARMERFRSLLTRLDDEALVREFLDWRSRNPQLVDAMIETVLAREAAERHALELWWEQAEQAAVGIT